MRHYKTNRPLPPELEHWMNTKGAELYRQFMIAFYMRLKRRG